MNVDDEESHLRAVVARADALMQRRRASAAPLSDELPVLTEIIETEEDFPVLTDAEVSASAPPPRAAPALPPSPLSPPAPEALPGLPPATASEPIAPSSTLARELGKQVEARLKAELPSLVEAALQSTLATLTKELEAGIAETTQAAIRDFLAEQAKPTRPRRPS